MTEKINLPLRIQSLFPDCVATACCRIADADGSMEPAEYSSIKHAVEARQQEFSAGRMCARQALKHLGVFAGPLRKLPNRSISWPEGITGTVSHNEIWCGAAVARRCDVAGIGLDMETVTRIGEKLWRRILTTEERTWLDRQPAAESQQWAALIFSAKEAVYKCIAALVPQRIGFIDAVIVPDLREGAFEVHLKGSIAGHLPQELHLQGRFFFFAGAVFTGLTLA
jgi:phosphopantetheine--protein transferase-like protein